MIMRTKNFLLLTGFLIFSFFGFRPSFANSPSDRPNIVVIMADDLGFSDLGCYGGEIHTPHLDKSADEGLRFAQFYNCSRCWPTRSALLTGYYPQQVNCDGERAAFPRWGYLLPHQLRQAGYRSYHSGKWHVPNVKAQVEQGSFNLSYCIESIDDHFYAENHLLNDEKIEPAGEEEGFYSTIAIIDYAIRFLEEHQQQHAYSPFFQPGSKCTRNA
jgi:arylsulfatase A-like enzyme